MYTVHTHILCKQKLILDAINRFDSTIFFFFFFFFYKINKWLNIIFMFEAQVHVAHLLARSYYGGFQYANECFQL